uniref:Secreted protein n=1 Tax=Streptomyces sp. NBC_00049 TaxID=2903617 RepID=A0AAU2JPT3_9ACTN
MNRRPLVIAAATVGVLATASFALPNVPPNPLTEAVDARVFKEKGKRFASAADAPTRADAAFALPSWIPKDATDVRIRVRTNGGDRLIRFTLGATPLDGPQCTAGTPKRPARPGLTAKWWPGDVRAEERPECRDAHQYQVSVRGKRVYAWTDGTPSPRSGS